MLQAVISKDSLMHGGVRVRDKLHGGRSYLLFALHQSSINIQLFVQNRDLCLSHVHSMPPLGDPHWNNAMMFGIEKR